MSLSRPISCEHDTHIRDVCPIQSYGSEYPVLRCGCTLDELPVSRVERDFYDPFPEVPYEFKLRQVFNTLDSDSVLTEPLSPISPTVSPIQRGEVDDVNEIMLRLLNGQARRVPAVVPEEELIAINEIIAELEDPILNPIALRLPQLEVNYLQVQQAYRPILIFNGLDPFHGFSYYINYVLVRTFVNSGVMNFRTMCVPCIVHDELCHSVPDYEVFRYFTAHVMDDIDDFGCIYLPVDMRPAHILGQALGLRTGYDYMHSWFRDTDQNIELVCYKCKHPVFSE